MTISNVSTELSRQNRFLVIDSLRGIAALSVALFHLSWAAFKDFDHKGLIENIGVITQWGYLGVPIFFVISGFVIAATIKPREVNFHYIGKFIVKRATRLDPPYWLSMALDISLVLVTIHLFHIASKLPTFSTVLAHLFYLQGLLGIRNIAAMYWTLCLEVQFYIFVSLIFAIANKLFALNTTSAPKYFIAGIFSITVLLSLLIAADKIQNPLQGLFLSHWYLFALGATCYWSTIANTIPKKAFIFYCAIVPLVFLAKMHVDFKVAVESMAGIATAAFIYTAAVNRKMSTWLNSRTLLYLGSISYSLYLFHAIVGERFISFFQQWLAPKLHLDTHSTIYAIFLFVGALAVSIVASHLVYICVERPSMNISKRIRPGNSSSLLSDIRGNGSETKYALAS